MRSSWMVAAGVLLAGCGGEPATTSDSGRSEPAAANSAATAAIDAPPASPAAGATAPALPPVAPIPPGEPGGLPDDRTPVSEAPFSADSAQGAANVVQTYYALLEGGDYAAAYRLWEPEQIGTDRKAFAESFAEYSEYHAQVGAPGRIDAGAGQRYVRVPVQVYGKRKSGEPVHMRGDVVLHRTAAIPGATAEQRRWRIRETKLTPRPR